MKIRHLFEEEAKHVTFCFGRMNPPTIGHKKLLDTMKSVGGEMRIFVSQSQDPKKNPLSYSEKISFMRKLFPEYSKDIIEEPTLNTLPKIAEYLNNNGYDHATFVAGSDRIDDMKKMLEAYNGKTEGKKGPLATTYKFETLDFVSSGEREDGGGGVSGISASGARAAAASGNFEEFVQTTGAGEAAKDLYNAVRNGMGIEEKRDIEERFSNKLAYVLSEKNDVDWDSIYKGINSAEFRGIKPGKDGRAHFIRTKGVDPNDKKSVGSTAYGPVQLTGKTLNDLRKRHPELFKGVNQNYLDKFSQQAKDFAKHGRNKGKISDYDPKFDYGSAGSLSGPEFDKDYKDMSIAAFKAKHADLVKKGNTNPSATDIATAWRGVGPDKDPEYFHAFDKGRLPKPTGRNVSMTNSETNEDGGLVIPTSTVRGVIIDMIADKIMKTNDYDKIAKWLKLIVGKDLKPKGQSRYIITSADVKEAIGIVKERIGK